MFEERLWREALSSVGAPDDFGTNFAFGDDVDTVELHGPGGSSTLLNFKCSEHSFLDVAVGPSLCLFCADGVS